MRRHGFVLLIAVWMVTSCHSPLPVAVAPTAAVLAELWHQPEPGRNLYWGVGGETLAPDPHAKYIVIEVKKGGFSRGLTVEDPDHRKWSVKFPPEAPTEIVASRLLWGVGYHQPPQYYVGDWNAERAPDPNPQLPGRFRETKPKELHGLEAQGNWSYYGNPFVGTREMNGLLVLQVMLANSDLKDEQNFVYTLKQPFEGAKRWYVARDLGLSFGRTGVFEPPRGDVKVFEETPFITGMNGQYVRFDWHGRHGVLLEHITPADVKWICSRLQALTDAQWQDAFRAGGYAPELADRFIRRFKQKIADGLALPSEGGRP
jgi:hypothetical protein